MKIRDANEEHYLLNYFIEYTIVALRGKLMASIVNNYIAHLNPNNKALSVIHDSLVLTKKPGP